MKATSVDTLSVGDAPLPVVYEGARTALAQCERVDECKDWADKAEALRSYARQSEDTELEDMARKIKARAIRRAGELLRELDGSTRNRGSGGVPTTSQRQAAQSAGMSKDQQVQAVRVAKVPESEFEAAVEAGATVTDLAKLGTAARPKPEGFTDATAAMGAIERLADVCREHAPTQIASGILGHERSVVLGHVETIQAWLSELTQLLENK